MINRRQFLRSAGGFALALPFLPSIAPRAAHAALPEGECRFFVGMGTHHGGIWGPNMYPSDSVLAEVGSYAGRTVRSAALSAARDGGNSVISPVLSASSGRLTDGLVRKMNVIRGVDIPFYIAHHTGGHLGNYARNDGNGQEGLRIQDNPRPTIDQVMAYSNEFYASIDGITERSVAIGGWGMSWAHASPTSGTGPIQEKHALTSNLELFNRLFRPGEGPTSPSAGVVDSVLGRYNSLRQSNARLSAEDRARLDQHMERLSEIERRLAVELTCTLEEPDASSDWLREQPSYGHDPSAMIRFWQLHNDIIAAAFACNVCRVASVNAYDTFSTFEGDWHQDVAHQANLPDGAAQETIATAHQRFFSEVFVDLCEKLDSVVQSNGRTVLDDALVMWTQESGMLTHLSYSIPIITAGSAGGFFDTGKYVDFRNLGVTYDNSDGEWTFPYSDHPGVIYNQWLATVLESMGVTPSSHRVEGDAGYGYYYVGPDVESDYTDATRVVNERLPFVTLA